MKIQNLRLGNYFMDNEGFFSQVIGFAPFEHSTRCDEDEGCYILLDQHLRTNLECESFKCKPIPLTEEWLFKFGAEEFPDGQSLVLNNRLIGYRDCSNVFYDKSTGINLQFVHKLQNLFYELIGEELKAEL